MIFLEGFVRIYGIEKYYPESEHPSPVRDERHHLSPGGGRAPAFQPAQGELKLRAVRRAWTWITGLHQSNVPAGDLKEGHKITVATSPSLIIQWGGDQNPRTGFDCIPCCLFFLPVASS